MSRLLHLRNLTRQQSLGTRIKVADTSLTRFVGLLGRSELREPEGLLIEPSNSVHMLGMRFAIDVLFLDREWRAVALYHHLKPFRITRMHWKAVRALELPAGVLQRSQTTVGDQILAEEV
ncbi:MAG: DUF192 domain-containing protein [Acidobacteriota bacterium]|nr:DUF192 domain-containing protein [Acidobacteriota bacterium]